MKYSEDLIVELIKLIRIFEQRTITFKFYLDEHYDEFESLLNKIIQVSQPILKRETITRKKRGDSRVLCIETNIIYSDCKTAHLETGINRAGIWSCLTGSAKSAGGYTWRFVVP